ncbi:uncharacterized protein LOC125715588 isoform X2 [Brienomyrus brachyistius]|uniref:uncharacterized protein LOC125715588 isoform X2 n=1 Tax=Brienomyrus brachyistius TaxID=42636 RepID=UPI0020B43099|nr:uncharacterized protein LOC125715588 isoform X2 [Brienomyrus brachyistius]
MRMRCKRVRKRKYSLQPETAKNANFFLKIQNFRRSTTFSRKHQKCFTELIIALPKISSTAEASAGYRKRSFLKQKMAIVAGFGPLEAFIGAEEGVALTDVDGKYWSPIECNGIYPIECCKEAKDPWCKFLIEKVGDHKVRMKDLRGVYLSRIHRCGIDFIEAAKNPPDVYCEFEVFVKDGKVLFRADNGKYLSLIDCGRLNIEAAKDGPDKYCEFTPTIGDIVSPEFEIVSVDFKNVRELTHIPAVVQKETYVNKSSVEQKHRFRTSDVPPPSQGSTRSRSSLPKISSTAEASAGYRKRSFLKQKMAIVAGFGPLEAFIGAEEGVALTDVDDKYWSPIERNGIYPIECCKDTKDPWCKFLIEKVGDHKVRMKDLRGVYLSRIHRCGIDFIEAAKNPPDVYCEFEVFVKDGKVLFRADNGKYLSLIDHGRLNIEAAKDGPDKYCEFTPTIGDIVSPKFEIISVGFMDVRELTHIPAVVQKKTYVNRSSVEQKHRFSMSWTKAESATTTWNHTWGLNSTLTFDCEFIVKFKSEVTISYSGSYGTSSTKEASMTLGEETEVTIPPHKKTTVKLVVNKQECGQVPFTAKIKKIKSSGDVQELTEQGTWRGVIYENVIVEVEEEDL